MRTRTLLLAACFLLTATAVRAGDTWQGAGWYVPGWYVMAYQTAVFIWSGPYDSKETCEAAKPADGDPPDFSYDCTYLSVEPG